MLWARSCVYLRNLRFLVDRVHPRFLTALVLLVPTSAFAQFGRTPTDGLRLPESSITVRDDALALELNPAGLARIQGFDFQLAYATLDDDLLAGTGIFLGGGVGPVGFGGALQYVENPALGGEHKKFTLGFAVDPARPFSLGLAFNYFDSDVDLAVDEFSSWDAGVQLRLTEWLGLAGTVRDFNTPRLGDTPLDPRYAAGLAFRAAEGRFRLEVDGIYESGPEDWMLRFRTLGEPLAGLGIFAELLSTPVDDFDVASLHAGLSYSFGYSQATAAVVLGFEGDTEFVGTSAAIRAVSTPIRTFMEPRDLVAQITLSGSPPERGYSNFLLGDQRSFLDLLVYLDELSRDEHVSGLLLRLEDVGMGLGQHWELRRALQRLRDSGRNVYVHLATADLGDLYIASVADLVYLAPGTALSPTGLSTTLTYFGDLFANIGVVPEFVRIGEYKAAAEAITEATPSEQTLEAVNTYLDDVFGHMVGTIAEGRERSEADVRGLIDRAPISAADAAAEGYVDGVYFFDEVEEQLTSHRGRRVRLVEDYDPRGWRDYAWCEPPRIAVVYVDGDIVEGGSGRVPIVGTTAGHRTLVAALEQLSESGAVRAIVLRVDSPGGSAWASEAIWRAVERANERVPVVVSMGNIAASGGYYVAMGGREVMATPLTLTGSIGVFAGHFVLRGLFDWAGLHRYPQVRGANANLFGFDEPWSDSQREAMTRSVQILYDTFLTRVSDNRDRPASEIDTVARGRIWSGSRALEVGLVDSHGGLIDAIEHAKALAGLEADARVAIVTAPQIGLLSTLLPSFGIRAGEEIDTAELEELGVLLRVLGLDRALRIPLLYGDGAGATRLDFELEGWE